MSSFVTNKFVSHLDQRDFDLAIGKLSYEIKHRKKEFLSLCTKNDPNLKALIEGAVYTISQKLKIEESTTNTNTIIKVS